MTPDKVRLARQLYDSREHTVEAIAKTLGVSRASIYRNLSPAAARQTTETAPRTVTAAQ